jgi:hypothetical protein
MLNRVDFYQSAESSLALPAGTVLIELDGSACPYLELIEIVRSGWPEFGWARLAYNPAGYEGAAVKSVEESELELAMGRGICIRQVYNVGAPGSAAGSYPLFVGRIEGFETRIDSDGERVEIVAKDFGSQLKRVSVYGQRVDNDDGTSVFLSGADTVFNEGGKANASGESASNNGYNYTVFGSDASASKLWSGGEAIYYLLCEHLPKGLVQIQGAEQIEALTERQSVRDLDVTGLSLADAVGRCCERLGIWFKLLPRLAASGPEQSIVFYRNGAGREVELNCQRGGQQLSISKTSIARLHSVKGIWPVTHKYIGQGDFKVYEATFDLVKAWDPADESTDYDTYCSSSNSEFHKLKDVYRKWCLNEAGDYSVLPYSQGPGHDFSHIFDGGAYVRRRRRFWPALTADKQGKSLGYFLEVSFDDGVNWWQYLYAFNNLLDECGVWLSSDRLDVDTWVAALKGGLKFRITASVVSDERLGCVVADGPLSSTSPVDEHVVSAPGQYKYRKVSGKSVFRKVTDGSVGVADEVDDSAGLYEFVRQKAQAGSGIIEKVEVQTPYLAFDYQIGDRVTSSPESRDLFSCRRDNRSTVWIERVQMDFRGQCTNLKLVRARKRMGG